MTHKRFQLKEGQVWFDPEIGTKIVIVDVVKEDPPEPYYSTLYQFIVRQKKDAPDATYPIKGGNSLALELLLHNYKRIATYPTWQEARDSKDFKGEDE